MIQNKSSGGHERDVYVTANTLENEGTGGKVYPSATEVVNLVKQRGELDEVLKLFQTIEDDEKHITAGLRRDLEDLQGAKVHGSWPPMIPGSPLNHSPQSTGLSNCQGSVGTTSDPSRDPGIQHPRRHLFATSQKVNLSARNIDERYNLPKRMATLTRPKHTGRSILRKATDKTRCYVGKPFLALCKKKTTTTPKKKRNVEHERTNSNGSHTSCGIFRYTSLSFSLTVDPAFPKL
ncbi:hypothetical protein NLI96_g6780 [Meripilus lineatus]|uniref:Uncharacterized protein n=1 Tax=Meripilus lineatus TaxID=2056292 RepID=A0AAD5YCN1_9APHY|nr:hypothetical protein NLI96_g6780 [Physisporinus lineatus]